MENESQRHRLQRCQQDVEENPGRASAHYNLGLAYEMLTVNLREPDGRNAPGFAEASPMGKVADESALLEAGDEAMDARLGA